MINDVAIVGAGPVGLLSALLLGQRGLSIAVYERWPNFYPLPRACTIDHEAIRVLQDAGLAAEFEPLIDPVIGPERLTDSSTGTARPCSRSTGIARASRAGRRRTASSSPIWRRC